jgi:hypothetical protein
MTCEDTTNTSRLLSSFVPALMLKAIERKRAILEPPATHNYQAVALFAVGALVLLTDAHTPACMHNY